MVSYPLSQTVVQPGEALDLLVKLLTRSDDQSVAQVAAANDCCPAHLYDLAQRARGALLPRRPGPVQGLRATMRAQEQSEQAQRTCVALRAQLEQLQGETQGAVVLDPRRLQRLELVMASYNVPFRGMHEILSVAFGPQSAPSVGSLHAAVNALGDRARSLIDRAREQVCKTLPCIAGDDVFLAGMGVKVVTEPRSNAVLDLGRCPGRSGADWTRWTSDFTALRLFVSDLGSDLVGAIDARPTVAHIIDYWHEMDWWSENAFGPMAREHRAMGRALEKARKAQLSLHGEERRAARNTVQKMERDRARLEREFYLACEAQELMRSLYEPTTPEGAPWTESRVQCVVQRIQKTLRRAVHDGCWAVHEHVERNAHRYGTHRVLMDAIEIRVRGGSPWTRQDVLRALGQERMLRRRANTMSLPVQEQMDADRQARRLAANLERHCENAGEVRAQWTDLVQFPRRSSSGTESFNNRLRVLQAVQRFVSDTRMSLHALAHNLTERTEGPRRGSSPYQLLGVDFATPGKLWYDVLLDAA